MSRFDRISDRALDLAGDVGDRLRHAIPDDVGQRLRGALPSRAGGGLLETGVALGAMRSGAKVAGSFARRHPAALAATVAGAGLLWYAAQRRKKRQAGGTTYEGTATRLDGNGNPSRDGAPHVRQAPAEG
ncbi:hypothetical protein LY625_06980 [Lysobacter sp. GX 14042]|uniref:hypothetical protein n=1 Tax=Lysobacter sp. GX 14042 TaxID=2907155 RepID=UPI001F3910C4|nr:hypothetical protein [Lysobacter sp. GX 14042]MCE7032366.1 hypothetical protein [Lysobacter sp. GX 14042]